MRINLDFALMLAIALVSSPGFGTVQSGGGSAQTAPATQVPPLIARPPEQGPAPGGQQRQDHPPQLTPTGLSANGGSIVNGVYSNPSYGFSLKVPPGWPVASVSVPEGSTSMATGNQSFVAQHTQVNRVLLVLTENAPFKKFYQRKYMQILATPILEQPIGPAPEVAYLTYSKKTAQERNMKVEYLGSPEELTLNGHKFAKIRLNDSSSGSAVQYEEEFVAIQNENLLQFYIVSPDEAGLKEMVPYIRSVQFQSPKSASATGKSRKAPAGSAPGTPTSPNAPDQSH